MTHGTLTCFLILSCFDHQNVRRGAPADGMVDTAADGGGDGPLTVVVTLGDGSDAPQPRTL